MRALGNILQRLPAWATWPAFIKRPAFVGWPVLVGQPPLPAVRDEDLAHMRDLHAAILDQSPPKVRWALYLLCLLLLVFLIWAALAPVEEVTTGQARIIAGKGQQLIQSLEGGIVSRLYVKEGDTVDAGQVLLEIDATRANAAYKEGLNKMMALQASAARLRAEAYEKQLVFPPELRRYPIIVRNETLAYNDRRRALSQSVAELQNSLALADKEVQMSEGLMARGLISDSELLRMKRQVNDIRLQIAERRNRYRTDANAELARVESDLAQTQENVAGRADTAQRTFIKAPTRGIVKDIRITTVGGVAQPASTIMEIVPLDDRLLVEAKLRPQDVAFIHPGLPATVKITAYDYSIYGGLDGVVELVSPDTLREESRTALAQGEESYYRVLVRTTDNLLRKGGKDLPIIPGMTAVVDIRSGQKTILDYLLKPVFKAREAFRER